LDRLYYDAYKNQIKSGDFVKFPSSVRSSVLDVMFSNKLAKCSFHHPGAFDQNTKTPISLEDTVLGSEQDESRYFASDHALIGADFAID
jgi:hypothetical protein